MSTSNDFSLFALFTAGLAAFTPLVSAYHAAVGEPKGNAIYEPGLNSIVPVGENYTITWDPTTDGTVSLILLKGPSTNVVPIGIITEGINNTGSYVWTPSSNLAPNTTGYGIQLIVDATGQYQYSTQFGISNDDYVSPSSSSSSSSSSSEATATSTSTSGVTAVAADADAVYTTEVVTALTTYCPEATSVVVGNKTYTVSEATTLTITDCPCTITRNSSSTATAGPVSATHHSMVSSGYGYNSTVVKPTGSSTVPSSSKTSTMTGTGSSTGSATASVSNAAASASASASTGGASSVGASLSGLAIAAGIAVLTS